VLALALPSLNYSALVMTETLYLPLTAVALWALARALEVPTARRQLVFAALMGLLVATRLQAVVLVPVFVTAVLVMSALERDRAIVRRFAPALVTVGVAVVTIAAVARSGALGAYSVVAEGSYDAGQAAKFVGYHLVGIVLLSGIVPALAFALVSTPALRGRESSRATRAFVAVGLSYVPLLALEVGVFSSRHVGHLVGRDVLTATPLLLLGLVLWLDRGAPRPQPLASVLAVVAAGTALTLPIRDFASEHTVQDVLELVPLERLGPASREVALAVAVTAAGALFVLVPRRRAWLLAPLLFVAFAATSVAAAREIERQALDRREAFFGGNPSTVADAGINHVAYLYTGEPEWTGVWQHLYWTPAIDAVWTLGRDIVPGPLHQKLVSPRSDGVLVSGGRPVSASAVLAPTSVTLVGERAAAVEQRGLQDAGLVLWRTPGTARIATRTSNVLANGDMYGSGSVTVYDCRPGKLELTLLGKTDLPISLRLNGITRQVIEIPQGGFWTGAIETQRYALEEGVCEFEIASDGLVGSTRLEFVPGL
jgi:hypothetical protein